MKWIWHLCFTNMKQRGIRTFLTILGVVIGVISIVSLLSIGVGVKNTILSEFMDNDKVQQIRVIGINEGKRKDRMITDSKVNEFSQLEHVKDVYPCLNVDGMTKYENYMGYGGIVGVPREYLNRFTPLFGELPADTSFKPEILMGQGTAYLLYNEQTGAMYMDTVEENERNNIDLTGESMKVMFGYEEESAKCDMRISGMLPNTTYESYCDIEILKRYLKQIATDGKVFGQPVDENGDNYRDWIYSSAIVIVDEMENVDRVISKLQDMGYQTENEKEYMDAMNRTILIIQLLLGGIGMIALLVAVIGIGNTMTTAVYDRIGEIGLLKVLGCDPDELLSLFLLESGILGGIGGVIGIICSYAITGLIVNPVACKMLHLEKGTAIAQIPISLSLCAVLFAVLLGVLAGFFPARWAAKQKPIDAIRHQ